MDPTLTRHVQPPSPRTRTLVIWAIGTATLAAGLATISIPLVLLAITPDAFDLDLDQKNNDVFAVSEPAWVQGPAEPPAVPEASKSPSASHADLSFVAHAGGRHFAILDRIEMQSRNEDTSAHKFPYPKNTQLLGELDYPSGAVMPVNGASVPKAIQAWRGQRIVVDGKCEAEITNIVRLSLVNGSPDYAVDASTNDKAAMLDYAVNFGAHYYAAELDECKDGSWMRHAALAPAQVAVNAEIGDRVVAKARRDLVRSSFGKAASQRWKDAGQGGVWHKDSDDTGAAFMIHRVRHPVTGQKWLVLQSRADYGCGGADVNVLAIYRVNGEEIERHVIKEAGDLISVDKLIDADGDGTFELLGTYYLDGTALMTDQANLSYKLEVPFFGCPC